MKKKKQSQQMCSSVMHTPRGQYNRTSQNSNGENENKNYQTNKSKDTIVGERFQLVAKIGKGSFGVVYEGIDLTTSQRVAVKIEKHQSRNSKELMILQRLETCPITPQLLGHGEYKNLNYSAMVLEGKDLGTLFENNNKQFTVRVAVHVAVQMLQLHTKNISFLFSFFCFCMHYDYTPHIQTNKKTKIKIKKNNSCLEGLHRYGVVHRDLKPQNFLIGYDDPYKLVIIDYGLSTFFTNLKTNKHIPYTDNCSPVGTG